MKKLCFAFFTLIVGLIVQAQTQQEVDETKLAMIKACVEFLATDREKFGIPKQPLCPDCRSVESLSAFVKTNNITRGDVLINDLKSVVIKADAEHVPDGLSEFKKTILNRVTEGPEKEYRKKLKSYLPFTEKLDSLASSFGSGASLTDGGEVTKDTSRQSVSTATQKLPQQDAPLFTPLGYAVVALLLIGLVLLYRLRKSYDRQSGRDHKRIEGLKSDNESLRAKVEDLRQELGKTKQDLKSAREQHDKLLASTRPQTKPAPKEAADVPAKPRSTLVKKKDVEAKPSETPAPQAPPAPRFLSMFARYADLGDGFSDLDLVNNASDNTVFELKLDSPGSGIFVVTDNLMAQRFALSNKDLFLNRTCDFDTFPPANARIVTDTPGTVKKEGDKWTITQKAKVRFE